MRKLGLIITLAAILLTQCTPITSTDEREAGGSIPYTYSTDASGAFTTNVPIKVPPLHGLGPDLALVYNSDSGVCREECQEDYESCLADAGTPGALTKAQCRQALNACAASCSTPPPPTPTPSPPPTPPTDKTGTGGSIPYSYGTDPSGGFTTSVPIEVPPFHGLEPKLALVYNSDGGNGFVGVGWTLAGLSSIQRASRGKGMPNYDSNDIFLLDGEELIPCATIDPLKAGVAVPPSCGHPATTSGLTYYTTRIERFQRIARSNTDWTIWTADGTQLKYEAQVLPSHGAYRYHLSRVQDTMGNIVTYNWYCDELQCYPDTIAYNGIKITFYRELRPDKITFGNGWDLTTLRYRLKTIDILVNGQRTRTYLLIYILSKTTGRSILYSARQYGTDADVDPANGAIRNEPVSKLISFRLDSATNASVMGLFQTDANQPTKDIHFSPGMARPYSKKTDADAVSLATESNQEHAGINWMSADVNGDGLQDWVYVAGPMRRRDLSGNTNFGFAPFITLITKPDGSYTQVTDQMNWLQEYFSSEAHTAVFFAGDFNSDGLADIIGILMSSGSQETYSFLVALSKGNGHYDYLLAPYGQNTQIVAQKPLDKNFHIDFSAALTAGIGSIGLGAGLGAGGNAGPTTFGANVGYFVGASPSGVGVGASTGAHVNGIGLGISYDAQGPKPSVSGGGSSKNLGGGVVAGVSGTGASLGFSHVFFQGGWMDAPDRWFAADFNRDGRTDLMLVRQVCGDANCSFKEVEGQIFLADGSLFFGVITPSHATAPNRTFRPGWRWDSPATDRDRFFLGDVNGDGVPDLMMVQKFPGNWDNFQYDHVHLAVALGGGDDGTTFTAMPSFHTPVRFQTDDLWFPGDVNGDGKTDFMHVARVPADSSRGFSDDHGLLQHWISDGTGSTFTATSAVEPDWPWNLPRGCVMWWDTPMPWFPTDVDVDGRADVMHVFGDYPSRVGCTALGSKSVYKGIVLARPHIVNGKLEYGVIQPVESTGLSFAYDQQPLFFPGDANGDGRMDLFFAKMHTNLDQNLEWHLLAQVAQRDSAHDTFRWEPVDINGDGLSDLVYPHFRNPGVTITYLLRKPDGTWDGPYSEDHFLSTSSGGDGFPSPHDAGWRVADINGDGRSDLVYILSDNRPGPTSLMVYSLVSNGSGFTEQKRQYFVSNPIPISDDDHWLIGDLNGNGMDDLIHLYYYTRSDNGGVHRGIERQVLLADPSSPGGFREWPAGTGCALDVWPDYPSSDLAGWRPTDLNGDGILDLVKVSYRLNNNSQSAPYGLVVDALISPHDSCFSWLSSTMNIATYSMQDVLHWRSLDLNGDGLADLAHIYRSDTGLAVDMLLFQTTKYGPFNSMFKLVRPPRDAWPGYPHADTGNWQAIDVNGDGLADFVHVTRENNGLTVDLLYSDGIGYYSSKRNLTWPNFLESDGRWMPVQLDVDGKLELVQVWDLPSGGSVYPGFRIHILSTKGPWDVLSRIVSPLGTATDVRYGTSISTTRFPSGCPMPVGAVRRVVGSIQTGDGRGGNEVQTYSYECPYWSFRERQFIGWAIVAVSNGGAKNKPPSTVRTAYSLTEACHAQVIWTRTIDDVTGKIFAIKSTDYETTGSAPPYLCRPLRNWTFEYELSGQSRTSYTDLAYDEYGNVTLIAESGDESVTGDERATRRSYTYNPAAYIVDTMRNELVYGSVEPFSNLLAFTEYCYDYDIPSRPDPNDPNRIVRLDPPAILHCQGRPSTGLPTMVRKLDDTTFPVNEAWSSFVFDQWGNVKSVIDAKGNKTTTDYDPIYHIYPITTTNALGQPTETDWDYVLGKPIRTRDLNGNWQAITQYSTLGYIKQVQNADGSKTTYDYVNWGDPFKQYTLVSVSDGSQDGLWTKSFFDGLGRTYRLEKKGTSLGETFVQQTEFSDSSTRPWREHDWYSSATSDPGIYEEYTYDALGRTTRLTHPDGTYSTIQYGRGETTATDEQGHAKTSFYDVFGRVVQVREWVDSANNVDTFYTYDALGRLTQVEDARGNLTQIEWDALGRKVRTTDPDMGTWTYRYDAVGNLWMQTDAKGVTLTFTYDKLNRVHTKQYSTDPTNARQVTWNYDENGHGAGIGQVTSVSDPTASQCPGLLSKSFVYDVMGRVSDETRCVFGTSKTISQTYDLVGRVHTLTYPDSETVVNGYDDAGQLKSVSGYVLDMKYDPAGRLTSTKFANGTSESFQYDPKRKWLTDASVMAGGPSPLFASHYDYYSDGLVQGSSSPTHKMNETYTYDGLHRLLAVSDKPGTFGGFPQTFTYDRLGNITYNSLVGNYSYTDPKHVHAVTQAGNTAYGYDDNGNLVSRCNNPPCSLFLIAAWNEDNLPTNLVYGSLDYNGDGERVLNQKAASFGSMYFGSLIEIEQRVSDPRGGETPTTTLLPIQYYFAGPRLVARKDADGTKHWYHQDRLGSTRIVTNGSGQVEDSFDYSAYGESESHQAPGSSGTDIQYTGHRNDGGFIYMNARYYDPILARFISADSIVPDPGSSQALNRYSYVYNNPISSVDPTGHQVEEIKFYLWEAGDDIGINYDEVPELRWFPLSLDGPLTNPNWKAPLLRLPSLLDTEVPRGLEFGGISMGPVSEYLGDFGSGEASLAPFWRAYNTGRLVGNWSTMVLNAYSERFPPEVWLVSQEYQNISSGVGLLRLGRLFVAPVGIAANFYYGFQNIGTDNARQQLNGALALTAGGVGVIGESASAVQLVRLLGGSEPSATWGVIGAESLSLGTGVFGAGLMYNGYCDWRNWTIATWADAAAKGVLPPNGVNGMMKPSQLSGYLWQNNILGR